MKIKVEYILIAALLAYIYARQSKPGVAGFYDSKEPNNKLPLKPYGARWGMPNLHPDTTKKALMQL